MTEIKIVEIRLMPWWKRILTSGDNLEVILEDERGNRKTVTVFDHKPVFKSLLRDFIAKKYCTGNQFWKPPEPKKKKKKKPKISREERKQQLLMKVMEVVGETFDCAVILSEEAEG